jgi:hypothetical protein
LLPERSEGISCAVQRDIRDKLYKCCAAAAAPTARIPRHKIRHDCAAQFKITALACAAMKRSMKKCALFLSGRTCYCGHGYPSYIRSKNSAALVSWILVFSCSTCSNGFKMAALRVILQNPSGWPHSQLLDINPRIWRKENYWLPFSAAFLCSRSYVSSEIVERGVL